MLISDNNISEKIERDQYAYITEKQVKFVANFNFNILLKTKRKTGFAIILVLLFSSDCSLDQKQFQVRQYVN